jgi:hypothetical protein
VLWTEQKARDVSSAAEEMRTLATLLVFLALGCAGAALSSAREPVSEAGAAPATAGEVVELRLDEVVSLGTLRLSLLELNDSRCPQGVQCVWEGRALATLEVSRADLTPQRAELILRPDTESAAKTIAGHELRLLNVEPYPREGVSPERSEYVATVEIRAL